MEEPKTVCQDDNDSSPNMQIDDKDEYEEEEILVHLEFDCDVDTKLFNAEEPKIIGLETDHPIMQMGPQFYRGTWQDTVGTSVFFEEDPDPPPLDPIFSRLKAPLLKLACHTRKSLLMSRVFVKPIVSEKSEQTQSKSTNVESEVGSEAMDASQVDSPVEREAKLEPSTSVDEGLSKPDLLNSENC